MFEVRCARLLGRATFAAPLLALLNAFPVRAQAPPPALPHDVTTYSVVYRVPAMSAVAVKRDLTYGAGAKGPLHADVFLPSKKPGRAVPAVVFVNGVGGRLEDWEIYRSWGRLVAAHGLAGITFEAPTEAPATALPQVMAWLAKEGPALGIDKSRVALWSCSGNVTSAMPFQMNDAGRNLLAAVVYYGTGEAKAIRTDLPVYFVLAGRDSPNLKEGIRALWTRAIAQGAPWTMVDAPSLTHAFDALDEGPESRRVVRETVEFLAAHLFPQPPAPPPSLARRALTHVYGVENAEAADAYREILAADPKDQDAQRLLGLVLLRSGKSKEAVEAIRKSIAMGSDGPSTYQTLGQALMQDRQYAEAIEAYERVVRARGPSPWVLYDLACAYALTGKKDAALDHLAKAVESGYRDRDHIAADPDLASLREEPRYKEIVASLAR